MPTLLLNTGHWSLITVFCLLLGSAAHATTPLPFYDDFSYANGTNLDGTNGWEIFTTGPGSGILPDSDHGWLGWPGGTATASDSTGRVAGVSLLSTFGAYSGEPGLGWPSTTGAFDKPAEYTLRYTLGPVANAEISGVPTTRSKFGTMYHTASRWHYENPGTYYKAMTTVRYFVKTNGLISAYDGYRIKHLTHSPITNRTVMTVTANYTNAVWSLWAGSERVVSNFALYKTHQNTDMIHDGWYKDYDGLKEIGFIDASTNSHTQVDKVRVFEGVPGSRALPFIETFETRTIGGETITMSVGDLNGQNGWFATDATIATAAQSSEPYSVGSNGVAVSGGGECFQLFLDEQTNVWSDLWLKPLVAGSGDTTVDAGGEDAVFRVDSAGDVHAYDGASASVVTSVVPNVWSHFTVHADYGSSSWSLYVDGAPVATNLGFRRVEAGNTFEELRVAASGSAVAHLDDVSVSLDTPFNLPTVSFQTDMAAVGENMTNVTVTAILSHAYISAITVDYVLRSGGSATLATDYSMSDGTLVFTPGETEKSFSFIIVNDADNEEDETLFFALTNIVNATAGDYLDITYTIESDPDDWYNIPFYEPFEDRELGDLQPQHGWTATHMTVQTNDTFAGDHAAQGVRIASEHAHAFSNGAVRVVTDWRAKAVFAQHAPTPPADSSFAFYVATNGHVVAFDGASAVDQGTNVILTAGQWAHFVTSTDHGTGLWELEVNGVSLATGLGFYSTNTSSYGAFGVDGPVTIDEIMIGYDAPAPPTGLMAVGLDSEIVLNWDAAQGALTYNIKRATSSGGPYSTIAVTNVTSYRDLTAVNDTTYYYVLSSANGQGEGSDSAEVTATPRAAVTGVIASSGIGFVNLGWDTYPGATNYFVKRSGASGGPYTTIASSTTTNYADTAVNNGQTYFYVIAAQTPTYVSTDSDEADGIPALRTIFYDSFETPAMTGRAEMEIPGWKRTNSSGNPDTRAGLWNEDTTSMVTPFGAQAAWVWSDRQITTTNIWEELQADAIYTLSFNAAAEYGLGGIDYDAELLAGTNVLGSVSAAWAIDTHDFQYRFDNVVFATPSNHPAIGQPLGIRLRFDSGAWQYVVGYDNVRLAVNVEAPPVLPDPMTFAHVPASHSSTSIVMSATTATNGVRLLTYQFTNTLNGASSGWIVSTNWINVGLSPGTMYGYRVQARDVYGNETDWSAVSSASPIDLEPPVPNTAAFAIAPTPSATGEISMTAVLTVDASEPVQYRFLNTTNGNDSGWSTNRVWTDTGLTVGQSYGYQVQARDSAPAVNSNTWSSISSTVAVGAPSAGLGGGAITFLPDAATLRGELVDGGAANATLVWGPSDAGAGSPSDWPNVVAVGSVLQGDVFSSVITGLTQSTSYAYRSYVTNVVGEAWSVVTNFTTTGARNVMVADAGSRNSWNTAANWTYGHTPTGAEAAAVNAGIAAQVDDNATPTYSGGLTLGSGASLQVGWTSNHAGNKNALGTGTITMHDETVIISRAGLGTYTFTQPLVLAGNATIWAGISTANHNTTKTFSGGVSGPGQLTYNGVNGTWFVFNTDNASWSGGFRSADPQNQKHRVRADLNGCFGTGDVAINNNCSLQVQSGVTDAIDDGATLTLDGSPSSDAGTKLVMNASDTVNKLFIDGVQQEAGTYTSTASWISGAGALTVLSGPIRIIADGAVNIGLTTADLVGTLNGAELTLTVSAYWSTNNHADTAAWLADGSASNAVFGVFTNVQAHSITGLVSDLTPATTYYYTLSATNGTTNVWAATNASFATLVPASTPTVTDGGGATNISVAVATLRGELTAGSFADAYICWGENDGGTSTSTWANVISAGMVLQNDTFSNAVSGLLYGIEYDYRVYVTNSAGEAWSGLATFATLPPADVWDEALGWSFAAWTGDADSGVSNVHVYTAAHSFGNNHGSVTVNGVTFAEGTVSSGTGWSIGGGITHWNGDDNANITGSSEDLAEEFVYNGNPRTVQMSGLTPGTRYRATYFSVGWEVSGRSQTFASAGDNLVVDQDHYGNNEGIRISYVFDAAGATQDFTITPSGGTFHMYALSNRDVISLDVLNIDNTSATNITDVTADLGGILDATSSVFTVYAYYSTNNNANAVAWLADGVASNATVGTYTNVMAQPLAVSASGLTPGATYYYTMLAANASTNLWASPNVSFKTIGPPTAGLAGGATGFGVGTATLRGELTGGSFGDAFICWGTSDGGTTSTGAWANAIAIGPVSEGIVFSNVVSGLTDGIEHDYRVYVTNVQGTAWSALATFWSLSPPVELMFESFEDPIASGYDNIGATGWVVTGNVAGAEIYAGIVPAGTAGALNAHSNQVAWLRDRSNGKKGAMQTTTNKLDADLTSGVLYTLTYNTASSYNNSENVVELLAGTTVLAFDQQVVDNSKDLGAVTGTVSFIAAPTHSLIGSNLSVRIRVEAGHYQHYSYVDNMLLTTTATIGDRSPPSPDPMTWRVAPVASVNRSIMMIAATATDESGVQYFFTNTVNGAVSGWLDTPTWTETNLTDGATNSYRVKARDISASLNETAWSSTESAIVDANIILYDTFEYPVVQGRTPENGTMAPGWTRSNGRVGLWNVDSGTMTTPFGNQAAWVWNSRYMTTTPALLGDTLTAGTTYTLTFNAAAENGNGGIDYDVELLAGASVVASVNGGPMTTSNMGDYSDSIVFTPSSSHTNLGETVAVRLRYISGAWQWVMGYDNVKLTAVPGPPPDPIMDVTPTNLSFFAQRAHDPVPDFQTYAVSNVNPGSFSFTSTVSYAEATSGWLSLSAASGVVAEGESFVVTARVSSATLPRGTYIVTNTLYAGSAGTQDVVVTLSVAGFSDSVLYDSFDYTGGLGIEGQDGGVGWPSGWINNSAGEVTPLPYVGSGSLATFDNYCNDGANHASIDMANCGDGGEAACADLLREAYRPFAQINSGVVYLGVKIRAQYMGTGKDFGLSLGDGGTPMVKVGKVDAASDKLGIQTPDGITLTDYTLNAANDYLVIMRYDLDTGDVQAQAHYGNSLGVQESWQANSSIVPAGTKVPLNRLTLFARNGSAGETVGIVAWDDVRLARNWNDLLCALDAAQGNPVVSSVAFHAADTSNRVSDAVLASGSFPLTATFYDPLYLMTDSTTSPFFKPNFDIVDGSGNHVIQDSLFDSTNRSVDGRTVVMSNAVLSSVNVDNISIGTATFRWSAINSNEGYRINLPLDAAGSNLSFTVYDEDTVGPTPQLIYIGPNYVPGGPIQTNITDSDLANTNNLLDVAVAWVDASGVFLTNVHHVANNNIGSEDGRVIANWDLVSSNTLTGVTSAFGYDQVFSNFIGVNGSLSVTTSYDNAFSVSGASSNDVFYLSVSAEDEDNDRGSDVDPQADGDDVPWDRTVITNAVLPFAVSDDDPDAPVFSAFNVDGAVFTNTLLANGLVLSGQVQDVGSGIYGGASNHFALYRFGQALDSGPFTTRPSANGSAKAATETLGVTLSALDVTITGRYSIVVSATDYDVDRTDDAATRSHTFEFTVVDPPLAPGVKGTIFVIDNDDSASQAVPLVDNFDAAPLGALTGHNAWRVFNGSATVQSALAFSGRAVAVADGYAHHGLNDASATNVWVDWHARPVRRNAQPVNIRDIALKSTAALYVNSAGHVVAMSNDAWVVNSQLIVPENQWLRFSAHLDYQQDTWSLYVAGAAPNALATNLFSDLPFHTNMSASLLSFRVTQQGVGVACLDNLSVGSAMPLSVDEDQDGIADAWENAYLGSTAAAATVDGDNDGFNNWQEFLAGTDPADIDSFMHFTDADLSAETTEDVVFSWPAGSFNGGSPYASAADRIERRFYVNVATAPNSTKVAGGAVVDGLSGTNAWTESNAAALSDARYYNLTVVHGGESYTNAEEWAMYRQARRDSGTSFICVPVNFGSTNGNNLNGDLGHQLGRGLCADNLLVSPDTIEMLTPENTWKVYSLVTNDSGQMYWWDADLPGAADVVIAPGTGIFVHRGNGTRERNNAVFVGRSWTDASVGEISFSTNYSGWTAFGWPLPTPLSHVANGTSTAVNQLGFASVGSGGSGNVFDPAARRGDRLWVWSDANSEWQTYYELLDNIGPNWDGRWWHRQAPGGPDYANFSLTAGRAYLYRHVVNQWGGTNFTWKPVTP